MFNKANVENKKKKVPYFYLCFGQHKFGDLLSIYHKALFGSNLSIYTVSPPLDVDQSLVQLVVFHFVCFMIIHCIHFSSAVTVKKWNIFITFK